MGDGGLELLPGLVGGRSQVGGGERVARLCQRLLCELRRVRSRRRSGICTGQPGPGRRPTCALRFRELDRRGRACGGHAPRRGNPALRIAVAVVACRHGPRSLTGLVAAAGGAARPAPPRAPRKVTAADGHGGRPHPVDANHALRLAGEEQTQLGVAAGAEGAHHAGHAAHGEEAVEHGAEEKRNHLALCPGLLGAVEHGVAAERQDTDGQDEGRHQKGQGEECDGVTDGPVLHRPVPGNFPCNFHENQEAVDDREDRFELRAVEKHEPGGEHDEGELHVELLHGAEELEAHIHCAQLAVRPQRLVLDPAQVREHEEGQGPVHHVEGARHGQECHTLAL
mmetsp:Transcript_6191/g.25797  ORF Transcript_6191/g.25797 Transcript_6191/m.25797 type:complete len:339 (-) Transcript_6191:640-1656(-)